MVRTYQMVRTDSNVVLTVCGEAHGYGHIHFIQYSAKQPRGLVNND